MAAKTCGKPTASGGRCQKPIGPAGTCGADHKAPTALATIANIVATGSADPMAGQRRPREPERPGGGFDTGLLAVSPSDRASSIADKYGLALNTTRKSFDTGYRVDVSHLTRDQVAGALTRNARGSVEIHTGGDDVFLMGDYDDVVATAHAATEEMHADTGLRNAARTASLIAQAENARFMGDTQGLGRIREELGAHGRDHDSDHAADNAVLHKAQKQANEEGTTRPEDYRVDRATLPATAKTTGAGSLFSKRFPIGTRVEIIPSAGAEPVVGTMAWGTGDYYVPGKSSPVIVVKMTDDNGSPFTVDLDKPSRLNSPDWQVRELATA